MMTDVARMVSKVDTNATDLFTIEALDGSGHLLLTWDPSIPESVERAQVDFAKLVQQGYQFFRVINHEPVTAFSPEVGALEVVHLEIAHVEAADVEPRVQPMQAPAEHGKRTKKRSGDIKQIRTNGERIVAARPMQGG